MIQPGVPEALSDLEGAPAGCVLLCFFFKLRLPTLPATDRGSVLNYSRSDPSRGKGGGGGV